MMNVGDNIKKMRELKNYTQEYMAQRLNLSKTAYGNIERGETDLTLSRLQNIAEIFETTTDKILTFDDKKLFSNTQINSPNAFAGYEAKNVVCDCNKRYIEHLEKEVEYLRAENIRLSQLSTPR